MVANLIRLVTNLRGGLAAFLQVLLANVFILGLNFATGIITARALGPSGRGELAVLILWPQVLAAAITLGLPSALLYNLRRYPERASQLFSAALPLGVLVGGISTAVGVLLIPYWLTEYQPEVVRFAQWGVLITPLTLLIIIFQYALLAREEFSLYNASRYFAPLITLLILGWLFLATNLTPFNSALAYLLPPIPILLYILLRLWRLYLPTFRNLGWAIKRLTSYGVRSSGIDLLGQLSIQMDRMLVVGFLSPSAMGLYIVASSLSQMLVVIPMAAAQVLFPKASGLSAEEVVSLTERTAGCTTAATVLAAGGLALFSPLALTLLYGAEYQDAIPIFRLLLAAMVIASIITVLYQAFMALDRPGFVAIEQIVGLGLMVPLLLVLVPRYGPEGAGLALLISALLRLIFLLASFPLVLKMRVPRVWPTRADLVGIAERFHKNRETLERQEPS
jgi:O-antigen/teichoic acid export membrane protein